MQNFLRYEEYKDSGRDWLGEVPAHWEVISTKFSLEIPITDGPHTTPQLFDKGVPFISAESVKKEKIDFNKKRGYISERDYMIFSKKYIPQKGDVYMVKSGATTGNTAIVETDDKFMIWSPLAVFRSKKEKVTSQYLHYSLQSLYYRKGVELMWSFGTQQNIGMGVLSNLPIILPPREEQKNITTFLNSKTEQIDRAIAQKEALIERLRERRQILIHRAVTRGLDADVEMKDSGVEWIGEVPKHWKIKRLKAISKTYGRIGFRGYSTSDLVSRGEGAITISPSNIKGLKMSFTKSTYLRWVKYEESPEIKIFNDDVLMVKTGSTFGKVGIVKNLEEKATINPQLLVFKNIKINKDLFYYLLRSKAIQSQVNSGVIGSTIPTISESKIMNFKVAVPNDKEVIEIVDYLKKIKIKFDDIIHVHEKQIQTIKEYKITLINAAVTGQIRVGE